MANMVQSNGLGAGWEHVITVERDDQTQALVARELFCALSPRPMSFCRTNGLSRRGVSG
jgi:hypothetical protein